MWNTSRQQHGQITTKNWYFIWFSSEVESRPMDPGSTPIKISVNCWYNQENRPVITARKPHPLLQVGMSYPLTHWQQKHFIIHQMATPFLDVMANITSTLVYIVQYKLSHTSHLKYCNSIQVNWYVASEKLNERATILGETFLTSHSTTWHSKREIFISKISNSQTSTSNVGSKLTSFASVIISGMKFTFSRRMLPLPGWRDLTLSMLNILPVTANCLACT